MPEVKTLRCFSSLLAAGTLALAPFADGSAESGEFDPSAALHVDAPSVVGTYAFDLENIISTQTQFVRREATEYQRKVAEARARAYLAAQIRAQDNPSSPKTGKVGGATPKPKGKSATQSREAAKAKLPRYIAVDTVKDERSAPGTKKVVMIFDTRSESLVNNDVYDVSNPPPVGKTEKFDTFSAQYIGPGVASAQ